MSRTSLDTIKNGYDYDNQAWYKNGKYVRCGHPDSMNCSCFGRVNEGKKVIVTPAMIAHLVSQFKDIA